MKYQIDYIEVDLEDALGFTSYIRDEDRIECEGMGHSVEEAIAQAYHSSEKMWMVLLNYNPAGLVGVGTASILGKQGCPWFLSGKILDTQAGKRALMQESPVKLQELFKEYDILVNYVDAEYKSAIRWLKWLGFKVMSKPEPNYLTGRMYYKFVMER